ncbi:hypothetical protein GCM10010512_03650 [Streptomyces thermoviolaceus subsp. thermoviolaceus]|nr:hypothetical protein GCM10010512_03650 [Streptomyces thermoviolaceus subsp. thermoviolaceus]
MVLSEKIEQAVTGRPDSHVPARVLQRLTGLPEHPGAQPTAVNWAMHYGQGALLGVLRSVMAHSGLRGPIASAAFTVVRVTNDQILENATGVGAPPGTWPRRDLVVDLLHKSVYAFTTGAVADALAARGGFGPGQRHAAVRPGRHADAAPCPAPRRREGGTDGDRYGWCRAMTRGKRYAVASSGQWTDEEDGRRRLPAGEVHAWEPGRNETVCGLSLSRSQLGRFPHVGWPDVLPESGGAADRVRRVCRRCAVVAGRRGADARPRWHRVDPRP